MGGSVADDHLRSADLVVGRHVWRGLRHVRIRMDEIAVRPEQRFCRSTEHDSDFDRLAVPMHVRATAGFRRAIDDRKRRELGARSWTAGRNGAGVLSDDAEIVGRWSPPSRCGFFNRWRPPIDYFYYRNASGFASAWLLPGTIRGTHFQP